MSKAAIPSKPTARGGLGEGGVVGGGLGSGESGLGGGGGLGSGESGLGGGGGEGSGLAVATMRPRPSSGLAVATMRPRPIVPYWRHAASRWTCPPPPVHRNAACQHTEFVATVRGGIGNIGGGGAKLRQPVGREGAGRRFGGNVHARALLLWDPKKDSCPLP